MLQLIINVYDNDRCNDLSIIRTGRDGGPCNIPLTVLKLIEAERSIYVSAK